ncbi:hypothetical protein D3C72_2068340 [compost metagenome]
MAATTKVVTIINKPANAVATSSGQEPRDQISLADAWPLSSSASNVDALGTVPVFSAVEISRGRPVKNTSVT